VRVWCKQSANMPHAIPRHPEAESLVIEPNRPSLRHPKTPPKWAHNPKVAGSNPAPAIRETRWKRRVFSCSGDCGSATQGLPGQALGQGLQTSWQARRSFAQASARMPSQATRATRSPRLSLPHDWERLSKGRARRSSRAGACSAPREGPPCRRGCRANPGLSDVVKTLLGYAPELS
jgi:hypothetical protein